MTVVEEKALKWLHIALVSRFSRKPFGTDLISEVRLGSIIAFMAREYYSIAHTLLRSPSKLLERLEERRKWKREKKNAYIIHSFFFFSTTAGWHQQ